MGWMPAAFLSGSDAFRAHSSDAGMRVIGRERVGQGVDGHYPVPRAPHATPALPPA